MKAKKSLGQNFLKDSKVLSKILKSAALTSTDHVVEVGPGHGVLTDELLKKAKKVEAIELDDRLIPELTKRFADKPHFTLHHQNALDFILPQVPYKVIANIPYYITSPLLTHFLHTENRPTKLVLLVQKEVAEKICETKKLNVLALHVQVFGKPELIATIPPSAFKPEPKVNSAILEINVYDKPLIEDYNTLFKTAHQAFTGKRKKLSNTLSHLKDKLIEHNLQDKRPEHLTIEDWKLLLN